MIPNDLAAELPPPRDDEPASLRQDIVDELADHLHCALQRELLASGGHQSPDNDIEHSAWQTVLTRFGNPAALARRLWFDAMKERLMARKIMTASAVLAAVATITICGLLWQSLRTDREIQTALLQSHEAFTASILEELKSFRTPSEATGPVDGWMPLTVKLVSEDGNPVRGRVQVTGTSIGGDKADVSIDRTTGAKGVAECGMLPYGNYLMTITATDAAETRTEHFMIAPGQPSERTVVCPTSPPPEVDLRFAFNPPESLKENELTYQVFLTALPRRIGSAEWSPADLQNLDLWVDASGTILKKIISRRGGTSLGVGGGMPAPSPGVVGLSFGASPRLREYEYAVQVVRISVPDINLEPGRAELVPHVEWIVAADSAYAPQYEPVTFAPKAGTENVWEIEIPDDTWKSVFEDFRKSAEARHVTIPEGRETVTVSGELGRTHSIGVGNIAGVVVTPPDSEESLHLLDSVRVIAKGHFSIADHGREVTMLTHTLLVTPEHKQAIEEAQRVGEVTLLSQNTANATDPVLREDVLEVLKGLPDREVEEPMPCGGFF